MPYDLILAGRIRADLNAIPGLKIREKKMFGGLAFMVNDKMCINVSGENLMCRFDPVLHDELSGKTGFQQMVMNNKSYKGYCYVKPDGFKTKKNFEFWLHVCLDFNQKAKSSKKSKSDKVHYSAHN